MVESIFQVQCLPLTLGTPQPSIIPTLGAPMFFWYIPVTYTQRYMRLYINKLNFLKISLSTKSSLSFLSEVFTDIDFASRKKKTVYRSGGFYILNTTL